MRSYKWALIQNDCCAHKKRGLGHRKCADRELTQQTHSKKATTYKPRREASHETNPVNTSIFNLQPPEL